MYVCMYVCVRLCVCMYTMYVCVCVYTMYTRMYIHTYVWMYACKSCMYACMYARTLSVPLTFAPSNLDSASLTHTAPAREDIVVIPIAHLGEILKT
jgi:hypothetical protein